MAVERSRITLLVGGAASVALLAIRPGARAGSEGRPGITVYKSPT